MAKDDLQRELVDEHSLSELNEIARVRGLDQSLDSKEAVIDWLLQNGLTFREYELKHNPYIRTKLEICQFFGIKEGWKILDVGCGSGGTSIAAASLVGPTGEVIAVDPSKLQINRCTMIIEKTGFDEIIETRIADVLELDFPDNFFDMVLLLYTPQFLGYTKDLKNVIEKTGRWTTRIGIADHTPIPAEISEFNYLLYNWFSNDLARASTGKRTDRLYHPGELRRALHATGWTLTREQGFRVSEKNSYPQWATKENIQRFSDLIQELPDPAEREIFSSRLETVRSLMHAGFEIKPTSMYAALAER